MASSAEAFDFDSYEYHEAVCWLREAERIVVFTGAGISAESGIPTFRDADGLWQEFPPNQFATWQGLLNVAWRQPRRLARFLRAVIEPIAVANANPAHLAIEQLEHHKHVTVITQNIDGLHQDAGNTIVHEVHGSILETITLKGRMHRLLGRRELRASVSKLLRAESGWLPLFRSLAAMRPLCGVSWRGVYRPRLVLFGDALAEPAWSLAVSAVEECDLLLIVGTSGQIYPAAMLPARAQKYGARTISIDPAHGAGDLWLSGCAAEILPQLVKDAFDDEFAGN